MNAASRVKTVTEKAEYARAGHETTTTANDPSSRFEPHISGGPSATALQRPLRFEFPSLTKLERLHQMFTSNEEILNRLDTIEKNVVQNRNTTPSGVGLMPRF